MNVCVIITLIPMCSATICHIDANFKDIKVFYLSKEWRRICVLRQFMLPCLTEIKWRVSDSVVFCGIMHRQMTYLLRVRVRVSVAALIVFCASTWVMSSALVSLMDTTQSPTPTPAWAAFPPGVSWTKENTGGRKQTEVRGAWRQEMSYVDENMRGGFRRTIIRYKFWKVMIL